MREPNEVVGGVFQVPIEHIRPDDGQVRKSFDESQIEELAASIRHVGVLEPIELRTEGAGPGQYVIVYGERRWRAARLAGLRTVPAFIDRDAARAHRRQLYENVMRVDLNPVELAANVAAVMIQERLDAKALAEQLHWSVRKIQRLLEIHEAPEEVKRAIVTGMELDGGRRTLSLSHALDVLRAYRHYARQDDADSKVTALARLDRLIRTVLVEDWSGHRLQEYVGSLAHSPKRDPLDGNTKNAERKTGPGEDRVGSSTLHDPEPSGSATPRHLPLFERTPDYFTIYLKRAMESDDSAARAALSETLLALSRELAGR